MNQNINLYQPMFRRQEKLFSAQTMMIGLGILLVGMGLIQMWSAHGLSRLEQRLADLQAEETEALARLEAIEEQFPAPVPSPALERRVAQAERERDTKQRALEVLDTGDLGNLDGFSRHVAGLARQRIEPVWLTRVRLDEGGNHMRLEGHALEADRVPVWVQELAEEEVFTDLEFRRLRMEQDVDARGRPVLKFRLNTRRENGS